MVRELTKGVLCLIVIAGVVVTLFAWSSSRPDRNTWRYRVAAPAAAVLGLGAFLAIHFRRDRAPDFLRAATGAYFDRGGLCFAFSVQREGACCVLHVLFQNRFERPCHGQIALRPARGFFMARAKIEAIGVAVNCGPGAFGVARLRIPIPAAFQGTKQKFDVGASVEYPTGRGRRLRNREGFSIGHNSSFGDAFGKTLALAGAAAGTIVFKHPASVTLALPSGVADEVRPETAPEIETIWVLGDDVALVAARHVIGQS
ncbi:MAG TPA: hypothetical protein VF595_15450 [Tepidisphaeraceae bacterium]|jgi:hypothetical protein